MEIVPLVSIKTASNIKNNSTFIAKEILILICIFINIPTNKKSRELIL